MSCLLVIAHIVRILRIVLIAQDLAADIVAMNHMCRIQVIPPALMGAATIVQAGSSSYGGYDSNAAAIHSNSAPAHSNVAPAHSNVAPPVHSNTAVNNALKDLQDINVSDIPAIGNICS